MAVIPAPFPYPFCSSSIILTNEKDASQTVDWEFLFGSEKYTEDDQGNKWYYKTETLNLYFDYPIKIKVVTSL